VGGENPCNRPGRLLSITREAKGTRKRLQGKNGEKLPFLLDTSHELGVKTEWRGRGNRGRTRKGSKEAGDKKARRGIQTTTTYWGKKKKRGEKSRRVSREKQ